MNLTCEICNKPFNNKMGLSQHIKVHNISLEKYYVNYINNTIVNCAICGNKTRFISIFNGYRTTCSAKCAAIYSQDKREHTNFIKYGTKNPAQNTEIKNKIRNTVKSDECQNKTKQTVKEKYNCNYVNQSNNIKQKSKNTIISKYGSYSELTKRSHVSRNIEADQFEIDNDCTRIGKLIQLYGQGWLCIKDNIDCVKYKGYMYIKNSDIDKIIDYAENAFHTYSHIEKDLANYLKSLNIEIMENTRQIIKPYELDIYIPNKNIAIEYNGNWYHSTQAGCNKDYHLMKSLLCRDKNIRLIHIYEFENFEQQKQLLIDLLINNIDSYNQNDFNKNNLIKNIPEPKLIYNTKYTIYGAGKLY